MSSFVCHSGSSPGVAVLKSRWKENTDSVPTTLTSGLYKELYHKLQSAGVCTSSHHLCSHRHTPVLHCVSLCTRHGVCEHRRFQISKRLGECLKPGDSSPLQASSTDKRFQRSAEQVASPSATQQQCAPGSGKKCRLYSGGNLPRGSRSASGMLTVVLFCWQLSLGCGWEKKESNRTLSR